MKHGQRTSGFVGVMAIALCSSSCALFFRQQDLGSPPSESPAEPSTVTIDSTSPPAPGHEENAAPENPDQGQSDSSEPITSLPSDCSNLQTQADMSVCAATLAQTADARLNQVYQQVRDRYQGTAQASLLIDAQLAWIDFRDANCTFASERFAGGTLAPLIYSNCIAEMTQQRTSELEQFLQEGR
jgi:uncharacterized protein YecT (DUF1311 family)